MQATLATSAMCARAHSRPLFQFKPSEQVFGDTTPYARLLKQMWGHVRGPELIDCSGTIEEIPHGSTVVVQLGVNDFQAYQFLVKTRQQRPDLQRVIVAHDPPHFPRSKLALAESISRRRAGTASGNHSKAVCNDDLDRAALSASDRWVTMSEVGCAVLTDRLRRLGVGAPKVGLIPHGLYLPTPQVRQRSARAPLSVGFFGNITRSRGLDALVDAALLIAEKHGLWMVPRFVVAGAPEGASAANYLSDLRARISEKRLDSRFDFVGCLSDAEIPAFFQNIDVLALPHCNRGAYSTSGPLHWAWTCGIPVLANRSPSFDELLTEHPAQLLASPSKQSWAERLLLLQWDHEFWGTARRAVLNAQVRNSWTRVVESFTALLENP